MADFLSSIFGSKPQVADYTPVNLQADQIKAIEGDIAAWPDIANLGNMFQQYMLNQYETAIPGFKDILKMGGQTTKDMLSVADTELHGQIPQDVQEQVQRTSAFQNLLSGGGGGMASANVARNYGLTSLDSIGQGAQLAAEAGNAAQRWAALSGAQMPEGMLITPQQQAALDMQQNLIKRNVQQQKYVAAAPNPAAQALNQWVEQLGGTIVASYAGGGMGGKGGDYKTSYNANQYGTGNPGPFGSTDPNSLFPGTDASGNPASTGGSGFTDVGSMFASTPYQSQIAPNPFGGGTTNINLGGMPTGTPYGSTSLGSATPIDLNAYFGQSGVTDFSGTSSIWGG